MTTTTKEKSDYSPFKKQLKNMENQEKTKVDSLHIEKTQEEDGDEKMTNEEWLEHSNRTLGILGIKERTFKNAGKCFVMPYRKPNN